MLQASAMEAGRNQRGAPRVAAIIVAAGRGLRAGGDVPKQYRLLAGRPVIAHAMALFSRHLAVQKVVAVINPADRDLYEAAVSGIPNVGEPASGGDSRQASCHAGLCALKADPPDIVLIHDAARPFASATLVDRAVEAALRHGAAVPGLPLSDTVKLIDEAGRVNETPPRSRLRAVQTPQAFRYELILAAHERAVAEKVDDLTDDGAVAEWAGHPLFVFPGEADNMKLTHAADFSAGERLSSRLASLGDIRTGNGFDVHAFTDGDHVWLNGLKIPHDRALSGHSDADVGLHALTDAILGAIGEGDIGSHFPPSDERWRGAPSEGFLRHAVALVTARGGAIANLDVTILCEAPKIGPLREGMRRRIAAIASVEIERVGVKATTTEKLGFLGRCEGIAAMAVATVRLPWGAS
jgi:2-C-methyl-D-erythritol 4-phosphate cytidylyltransferase / 2-C-methyl-D-erythritol 2,4-cyclodiphosphate synthase